MEYQILLEQEWMNLMGPKISCSLIHPHTTCVFQIVNKSAEVVKKSSKLYSILYIAMFLVKFRKLHSQRKIQKTIRYFFIDYLWSLGFMSWIVGGMKMALCLLNTLHSPLDGRAAPLLSILGSPSIYFINKERRHEVVLFTFVRGCRSAYIYLKKRYGFKVTTEKQLCFIFIYGMLSYFYFEKRDTLRNKDIMASLWGDF